MTIVPDFYNFLLEKKEKEYSVEYKNTEVTSVDQLIPSNKFSIKTGDDLVEIAKNINLYKGRILKREASKKSKGKFTDKVLIGGRKETESVYFIITEKTEESIFIANKAESTPLEIKISDIIFNNESLKPDGDNIYFNVSLVEGEDNKSNCYIKFLDAPKLIWKFLSGMANFNTYKDKLKSFIGQNNEENPTKIIAGDIKEYNTGDKEAYKKRGSEEIQLYPIDSDDSNVRYSIKIINPIGKNKTLISDGLNEMGERNALIFDETVGTSSSTVDQIFNEPKKVYVTPKATKDTTIQHLINTILRYGKNENDVLRTDAKKLERVVGKSFENGEGELDPNAITDYLKSIFYKDDESVNEAKALHDFDDNGNMGALNDAHVEDYGTKNEEEKSTDEQLEDKESNENISILQNIGNINDESKEDPNRIKQIKSKLTDIISALYAYFLIPVVDRGLLKSKVDNNNFDNKRDSELVKMAEDKGLPISDYIEYIPVTMNPKGTDYSKRGMTKGLHELFKRDRDKEANAYETISFQLKSQNIDSVSAKGDNGNFFVKVFSGKSYEQGFMRDVTNDEKSNSASPYGGTKELENSERETSGMKMDLEQNEVMRSRIEYNTLINNFINKKYTNLNDALSSTYDFLKSLDNVSLQVDPHYVSIMSYSPGYGQSAIVTSDLGGTHFLNIISDEDGEYDLDAEKMFIKHYKDYLSQMKSYILGKISYCYASYLPSAYSNGEEAFNNLFNKYVEQIRNILDQYGTDGDEIYDEISTYLKDTRRDANDMKRGTDTTPATFEPIVSITNDRTLSSESHGKVDYIDTSKDKKEAMNKFDIIVDKYITLVNDHLEKLNNALNEYGDEGKEEMSE